MVNSIKKRSKISLCLVCGSNPHFLGGISVYCNNLVRQLKEKYDITWIYKGNKDRRYSIKDVDYIEVKVPKQFFIEEFSFNKKVKQILDKTHFDIINSHAVWGYWIKKYKKKANQRIIHTYHGSTYHFFKNHFKAPEILKKLTSPLGMSFGKLIERPPFQKADELIYISDKVKKQMEELYSKSFKGVVLRTATSLEDFKKRNKKISKREIGLSDKLTYGLHIGRGGYWTKGLDRSIELSEKIYSENNNFRLIVIGPEERKVKHLLNRPFIISLREITREEISSYYSSCDIFFCMSRYEGGAPTLVVAEAMASGCLIVCSKDSQQEIIKNSINGIVVENLDAAAKRIKELLKRKDLIEKITKRSRKDIKGYNLKSWSKKYESILKR